MFQTINEFTFNSNFDSGNLNRVELNEMDIQTTNSISDSTSSIVTAKSAENLRGPNNMSRQNSMSSIKEDRTRYDHQFKLWTEPDGSQMSTPTKNRTWFHFSMEYKPECKSTTTTTILFQFMNLNRVQRLFNNGMKPVYRHEKETKWKRIPISPGTKYTNHGMEMQFVLCFSTTMIKNNQYFSSKIVGTKFHPLDPGIYYFAYCLPYSYTTLKTNLDLLQTRLGMERLSSPSMGSMIPRPKREKIRSRIYFHREVLVMSCDGRDLDVVTITSDEGMLSKDEDDVNGLFPKGGDRCRRFDMVPVGEDLIDFKNQGKKSFFFISARVHPAETVASYMLDGFIDFITSSHPKAQMLRSKFVFKIIPMLNPDGVYRGHYRGDHHGVNLNRVYLKPDPILYPTIWATKTYIQKLLEYGQIQWYFDLHGHANKFGSFLFGNWINDLTKQYDMLLFTRYCYMNNPLLDINECDFAPKGMLPQAQTVLVNEDDPKSLESTKDGTGRVSIYKLTGIHHCYTFEANYYGTKLERRSGNVMEVKTVEEENIKVIGKQTASLNTDRRFTLADMKMMGKSLALACFDMEFMHHPNATIGRDDIAWVPKVHDWVVDRLRKMYVKAHVTLNETELALLEKEKRTMNKSKI
ncbi:hypothetical protein BC833DRAFT_561724 [Globomyces pollinis-pini]|nr:hypothetical protein BC833DRAFT_561724 [Globomyces pollinis-pini]